MSKGCLAILSEVRWGDIAALLVWHWFCESLMFVF